MRKKNKVYQAKQQNKRINNNIYHQALRKNTKKTKKKEFNFPDLLIQMQRKDFQNFDTII